MACAQDIAMHVQTFSRSGRSLIAWQILVYFERKHILWYKTCIQGYKPMMLDYFWPLVSFISASSHSHNEDCFTFYFTIVLAKRKLRLGLLTGGSLYR